MSHEFENGFFTTVPAWHGLGTVVKDAPSIAEALQLAQMDYQILEVPVYSDVLGQTVDIAEYKALIRSSDNKVISVMKSSYEVLQNKDAFSFFDQIVDQGLASLDAAFTLCEGKRVVIVAKTSIDSLDVLKGDEVTTYIVLAHAHDGSLAVTICISPIRVVCMNTLTMMLNRVRAGRDNAVRIYHRSGMHDALSEVKQALNIGAKDFTFTIDAYKRLAGKAINELDLKKYVRNVFEMPALDEHMPIDEHLPRAYEYIAESNENGPGTDIPGVRGTVWGAYNAVTDWIDHERGRNDSTRLNASWFGPGKQLRDRALSQALELVN